MKVTVLDLRGSGSATNPDSLRVDADCSAVIFVGHGTRHSVGGYTSQTFPILSSVKIIWLYACNCGKKLIKEIAERHGSATVFGYTTNVIAPMTGPIELTVAGDIKEFLEEYSGPASTTQILRHVQDRLLKAAIFHIKNAKAQRDGRMLMVAALINHTRLSLRFAEYSARTTNPTDNPGHLTLQENIP
jgi:hypothetical protein